MKNPQKEHGYTPIANEIMEALAGIRINGEARQCLDVILRKTYGFNKKEDTIALSQFCLITHLGKEKVCKALSKLRVLNIIITQKGNGIGNIHRFNKDYSTWKPLPKKVTLPKKVIQITQKGNSSLPKKVHTKDNYTKDTITKELAGVPTSGKAEYGNPEVNDLIKSLKEEFELGILDGSDKLNRQYAKLMITKCGGLEIAKKVIKVAALDDYWGEKIADVKTLYYHMAAIVQKAKNKKDNIIKI